MKNSNIDIYYASAGVGKTTKLLDIVDQHIKAGVPIERIAFLTFTKKAAEVAKMRTSERFGIPLGRLENFRTIHSLCFKRCGAKMIQMMDRYKYKEFGDESGYDLSHINLNYAEGISWRDNNDTRLVALEQLYRNNPKYCEKITDNFSDMIRYMTEYTKYRREHEVLDFTDLLENYIKNDFTEDVDVVCLDEMQDSTPLQWRVVFQAFRNAEHIYIAGDDKQAIYQFAGASPDVLVNMKGNQHILDTSYRVPSEILEFSNQIASEISVRSNAYCKAIKQGGEINYLTDINEIEYVSELYAQGKTVFMLARNNKFLSKYVDFCKEHGIQYKYKGEPVFSSDEKFQFKYGMTELWSQEKLMFAMDCDSRGTFYDEPRVNISTIHSVKGDEADAVILMGDISKVVSQQMDIDEDTEHRSFYVGVTRAKERLYIIEPQTKIYYPYLY